MTYDSLQSYLDLKEAITRAMKPITVWWQDDDGGWHDRQFANEAAVKENELKWAKSGTPNTRTQPADWNQGE